MILQGWLVYYWMNSNIKIELPCEITMIRYGPRLLDSDNLQTAFKSIRDKIADLLIPGLAKGQADGDPRLIWRYDQQKSKTYNIRLILNPLLHH